MSKKMILLALVASLAFIIGACASGIPIDPAVKGKIGDPVAPSGRVLLPTELTPSQPLSVDLSKTPAAPGKIGDPVAPSGRVTPPGELAPSSLMK